MAADIRERTKLAVASPDNQQWFIRDGRREVLPRLANLIGSPCQLPTAREDVAVLIIENGLIEVVARRKRPRVREPGIELVSHGRK